MMNSLFCAFACIVGLLKFKNLLLQMINNFKKFLNEEQDSKAVEKLLPKADGLLSFGEIIEYMAV